MIRRLRAIPPSELLRVLFANPWEQFGQGHRDAIDVVQNDLCLLLGRQVLRIDNHLEGVSDLVIQFRNDTQLLNYFAATDLPIVENREDQHRRYNGNRYRVNHGRGREGQPGPDGESMNNIFNSTDSSSQANADEKYPRWRCERRDNAVGSMSGGVREVGVGRQRVQTPVFVCREGRELLVF